MQEVKATSDWFTAASENLADIEKNAADYEDPEEGDKAPSAEVFTAVREFLTTLKNSGEIKLETPHIFVSPNGQLILTYGNKSKGIDIRFSPAVAYFFKQNELGPINGEGMSQAVKFVTKHFSA